MDNSNTLPLGSAAAPAKERTTTSRIKSIFSGSVGNMVEWYDWYVYAAFSLYFAKAFFPKGDTTAQLLNTAAIFAVGFLMRPIGGWLMGLYADRAGRKAAFLHEHGADDPGGLEGKDEGEEFEFHDDAGPAEGDTGPWKRWSNARRFFSR